MEKPPSPLWKPTDPSLTKIDNVTERSRSLIEERKGLPSPKEIAEMIMYLSAAYELAMERSGVYRAMRDQLMAQVSEHESASKAEMIGKGSEFGMCYSYFDHRCNAIIELINSLKKVQDYWNEVARNNY